MALEDIMIKLTAAIEANTKALEQVLGKPAPAVKTNGKAPDSPEQATKAAAKSAKKATLEDVRLHLNNHAKVEGKPATLALLKDEFGADSPADLDPDKYQSVIDRVKPQAAAF